MNIEKFRDYCLQKKGVSESFPFDQEVLVFKVLDKMFALTNINSGKFKISLKCNPDWSLELREQYPFHIKPAFHMNKKHWNSVILNQEIPQKLVISLIDHSYDLVVSKMPKKNKEILANLKD